ncbi:hypothetical protein SNE40_022104 [Patella caerulea]|uniref:Uncharacterized protein n=1 Tax=Patella caerulea TaxID=87958 RepID=A0AAN8GD72_PATCE
MQRVLTKTVLFFIAVSFIRGNATCDDEMSFYADGVLYAQSDDWNALSAISIPCDTTVMAIKCQDKGGIAGIKAALDNGIKTNISWKCSNTFESGWNQIGFNDSAWSFAVIQDEASWRSHAASLVGKADWIWTCACPGGKT